MANFPKILVPKVEAESGGELSVFVHTEKDLSAETQQQLQECVATSVESHGIERADKTCQSYIARISWADIKKLSDYDWVLQIESRSVVNTINEYSRHSGNNSS